MGITHIYRAVMTMAEHTTTKNAVAQARAQRDAAAQEREESAERARAEESQQVWDEMHEARDRAEEMGDRVEDGTQQTGTGGRDAEE
jgi:hypothetical protein